MWIILHKSLNSKWCGGKLGESEWKFGRSILKIEFIKFKVKILGEFC